MAVDRPEAALQVLAASCDLLMPSGKPVAMQEQPELWALLRRSLVRAAACAHAPRSWGLAAAAQAQSRHPAGRRP